MPFDPRQSSFKLCCGKAICYGCIYAMILEDTNRGKRKEETGMCAFCRTPFPSSDEDVIKQLKKQIEKGNGEACVELARYYADGYCVPQDQAKANELYLKAGELDCATAYYNLACSYRNGTGVEVDKVKANHYFELSAMMGDVRARSFLGVLEAQTGNMQRSCKHLMIAARAGYVISLEKVKQGFMQGFVTKEEYECTLRAYHNRHAEMKSDMRDEAAALLD